MKGRTFDKFFSFEIVSFQIQLQCLSVNIFKVSCSCNKPAITSNRIFLWLLVQIVMPSEFVLLLNNQQT